MGVQFPGRRHGLDRVALLHEIVADHVADAGVVVDDEDVRDGVVLGHARALPQHRGAGISGWKHASGGICDTTCPDHFKPYPT